MTAWLQGEGTCLKDDTAWEGAFGVAQVDEYDLFLSGYQQAAVATENVAAVLNAGQGFILSSGLTAVLAFAALLSPVGSFTAGDLVSTQLILTSSMLPNQVARTSPQYTKCGQVLHTFCTTAC